VPEHIDCRPLPPYLSPVMISPPPGNALHTSVQFLKGIGPRKAEVLERAGIRTILDLFLHVPRRYLDRSAVVTIGQLRAHLSSVPALPGEAGADVRRDFTVVGTVRSFRVVGYGKKARLVLVLADDSASMQCVWFGGVQYWKKAFDIGETLAVSGQPSFFGSIMQFVHPAIDRIAPRDSEAGGTDVPAVDWTTTLNTGGLVPLYPSGQELERVGLDSGGFRRILSTALRLYLDSVAETLPASLLASRDLPPLTEAIRAVHMPRDASEIDPGLRRLKYEELFFFQITLALKRQVLRDRTPGIAFTVKSPLARQLVDTLPFALTDAQRKVIREISADMESPRPMNRLLQGDVGSGKTVVALLAMLIAVNNGYQAVFMAPTEILAEQHYRTLAALLRDLPVTIRLLVGSRRTTLRRDILEDVRSGAAQIVVGTHALFEKDVRFANLGFVVIDEQHRFGVLQRALLRKKGENPDVLVMTATPIPRTLSLTLYGDLDVSVIDELPKGRKPITTMLKSEGDKDSVYAFVRNQIAAGRQAYFVYPLIEESEKLDLKAATVYIEHLQRDVFPDLRIGLLHGRMPSEEKDAVMAKFKQGGLDCLVATTVIEVGIDVPNATVMVIEDAERYGLSQLHQLRGRVGRGGEQSYCILLTKGWIAHRARRSGAQASLLTEEEERHRAERRLATMIATNDGFKIAEVDLELRGPGDFFGTRQSGVPEFKVADILQDGALLRQARDDAFSVLASDPSLSKPEHRMLADRMRASFRDAMTLLQSG
jgi:ATP-dependent DNA helicase RecG